MDNINGHGKDYIDNGKFVTDHKPNKKLRYKSTNIRSLGNIST